MLVTITPRYHDIFDGPRPTIADLLCGIPSDATLHLMCLLNAEFYTRRPGIEQQERLFGLMTIRQPPEIVKEILRKSRSRIVLNNGEEIAFFSTIYNLEFIHYELTHFREGSIEEITPEQDLAILKAYFLITEEINNVYTHSLITDHKLNDAYFYKMAWPTFLDQFELNQNTNPFTVMLKGLAFFNQLEYKSPYAEYVKKFLIVVNQKTSTAYLKLLISTIVDNQRIRKADGFEFANYSIPNTSIHSGLMYEFSIDINAYKEAYTNEKANYRGIREKPLLKVSNEGYMVLNWSFLSNKLYDALLFDFYKLSGLSENKTFKIFPNFKQYVSEKVTEGYLFKTLMSELLNKKTGTLLFDERSQIDNHPDCYYRDENNLLLFEIKDAYFPAEAVTSVEYESIRAAIENKYNNIAKGKGVPQIIKQLELLANGTSFEPGMIPIDTSQLNIYPVMIFNDGNFNLPGINDYLNSQFQRQLEAAQLNQCYKSIRPLTFINLSFFIDHFSALSNMQMDLFDLIDAYDQQIKNLRAEFLADPHNDTAFFAQYDPFEKIIHWIFTKDFKAHGGIIKSIMMLTEMLENDTKSWKA